MRLMLFLTVAALCVWRTCPACCGGVLLYGIRGCRCPGRCVAECRWCQGTGEVPTTYGTLELQAR